MASQRENCKCETPEYWESLRGGKSNICKRCGGFLPEIDKELKERRKKAQEKRDKALVTVPPHSSKEYPNWVCKGGCEQTFPENTPHKKCPNCMKAPLVRWLQYEERR